ncbi:clotting factor G beta subunit-like isoform X2 [Leptopilina boulardi]|uniref:clotting factor G beta subunit-like isoform X2 n=1 Tax=Leptopilina boulardi TaxID=63433 RepID=UPI0021F66D9B|nr:clotting factor G beta subunit-like isoform X2 [Leptopilina boulardi]
MNLQHLKILHYLLLLLLFNYSDSVSFPQDLYEGDTCYLEGGIRGVCKNILNCMEKIKETREGKRNHLSSDHCSFKNRDEIVCCPIIIDTSNTEKLNYFKPQEEIDCCPSTISNTIKPRIADKVCVDLENGGKVLVAPYVVNGIVANSNEFPFMVALGYEKENAIKYLCGGSLISTNFVLTAAHCIININNNQPVEVRMGSENLNDNSVNVQKRKVDKMYPHPDFNIGTHYNDIALLKLKDSIHLTANTKPTCLQSNSIFNLDASKFFIVASGFGATGFENEGSDILMKTANLSLVKNSQCNTRYKGQRKLPRGIDDSMLCYIDPKKKSRSDTCPGDSGGPLIMVNDNDYSMKLLGVTSFGEFCGGSAPGVYTAIYNYLDWIESIAWGNSSPFY